MSLCVSVSENFCVLKDGKVRCVRNCTLRAIWIPQFYAMMLSPCVNLCVCHESMFVHDNPVTAVTAYRCILFYVALC